MGTITAIRDIPAAADAVWAVLADFPGIAHYHPAVVRAVALSEATTGEGATRRCDFDVAGAKHVEERIVRFDATGRSYDVAILGGTFRPPIGDVVATLAVDALDDGTCRVTMTMRHRGNPLQELLGRTVVRRRLQPLLDGVLAGLDLHVTTGREVTGFDDLAALAA